MNTSDLVYVGIKGSVVALNRKTGEQVWATRLKGWDFVNLLLEDGVLLASCYGEVFCLDALTGEGLWHNRMKGYGVGLASLVTQRNPSSNVALTAAEKRRRDEESSSASGTTTAATRS